MVLATSALEIRKVQMGAEHATTVVTQGLVDHLKKDLLRESLGG